MRNDQRVFDADTHFHPSAESLVPYLSDALLARKSEFGVREQKIGWAGEELPEPYRHLYRLGSDGGGWGDNPPRWLGEAGPRQTEERHFQHFMGFEFPSLGGADFDLAARVADMDREGMDIHLMVPSAPGAHADPAVDMGMIQATHRYLDDLCTTHAGRLMSLILTTARDVEGSVAEIKHWAKAPWAKGIMVNLPIGFPVDHPDLHPIWAAADEANLAVVHHSFAAGYPGYRDLWDSPFIGRTASHPWAAMRMVAGFIGSGLMDRYKNLRLAVLESGFGWLPFWAKRMEDQVVYMGYVPELEHKITDYFTGGRFFCSIVLHEGEDMVRMVTEMMGDHVLMFGSDYPHAESRFPKTADIVMDWKSLNGDQKRKLMWENAARCFALD